MTNGDFETITSCPYDNSGNVVLAQPWFIPNGDTPDLFNTCATSSYFLVPQNGTGWQSAHSGNGYAGIAAYNYWYNNSNVNVREYIEIQLNDSMRAGKKYGIEFYASLADSSFWAINRLGACITKNILSGPVFDTISAIPQIMFDTTTVFQDTANWVRISGTYYAFGGERYLTIGNFYADNQTDTISHLGSWIWAYYYIDDVSVTDQGYVGINPVENSNPVSITPNPSTGNVILIGQFPNQSQLEIFDMTGRLVMKPISIPEGNNSLPIELNLSSGIYYLRIVSGETILHEEKLVIAK